MSGFTCWHESQPLTYLLMSSSMDGYVIIQCTSDTVFARPGLLASLLSCKLFMISGFIALVSGIWIVLFLCKLSCLLKSSVSRLSSVVVTH